MAYVSITGLRVKGMLQLPRFWLHAFGSMGQAQRAKGCQSADARTIDRVHHTLSVWDSRKDMLAFMMSGAHRKAVRNFPAIATGSTYGYETDALPDWDQARALWLAHGREYGTQARVGPDAQSPER